MAMVEVKLYLQALCISASLAAAIPVESNHSAFDRILKVNKNSTQPLFEGDIVVNQLVEDVIMESKLDNVARDAVRNREYLWVTRIVPYVIAKNYSANEQGVIEGAMKTIENETCITFKEYTNERHWIRIEKSKGCSSSVGRDYTRHGMQTVSLGSGCLTTPVVLHELLHTLGFWHEQSRPDRDKFIEIFWENIKPGDEHNFEKYSHKEADTLGLPYDYSSVMHYTKTSSSKNGKPTMLAIGKEDVPLGSSNTLTSSDILQINRLYECKTATDSKTYVSSWTLFGPCDYKCEKRRQRFCFITDLSKCPNVNPNGVEEEVTKCAYEECYAPIDGHWGRWSTWGDCIPDCGPRKQVRTRKCNNPEPKYGGKSCHGEAEMSLACASKSCSLECNFEQDWCGWTNSYTNSYRFNWLRVKGKTFSENTGPSRDHTTGNGYYIAVEASSPALPGDRARVMSKQRKAAVVGDCIRFWYHMFGLHIATLRVILRFDNGVEKTIWSVTGNKGDAWISGNVTAYSSKPYQVIFESERGNGYQGDIAIDDINVQPEKCGKSLTGKLDRPSIDPVGCFRDSPHDRALPYQLESQRHTINWFSYESSLSRILKSCIAKAKLKGYKYIGLQFYGECWAGPTPTGIYRHGPSKDCINGRFEHCSTPSQDPCTGKDSANFIYRLL